MAGFNLSLVLILTPTQIARVGAWRTVYAFTWHAPRDQLDLMLTLLAVTTVNAIVRTMVNVWCMAYALIVNAQRDLIAIPQVHILVACVGIMRVVRVNASKTELVSMTRVERTLVMAGLLSELITTPMQIARVGACRTMHTFPWHAPSRRPHHHITDPYP